MTNRVPKTPFATRLSGSAKETQLRIRSMFQWQKKRPSVWLFALVMVVILGCIGLVSCQEKEDVLCMGLNARVIEIDPEQRILYIQDIDESAAVFGQRCALDCKQAAEKKKLIFVDYETSDLIDIPFAEFQVGDTLIISMYNSQKEGAKDAAAQAEQVQLGTQRPLYTTLTQTANRYSKFIENCWSDGYGYQYAGFTEFENDGRTLVLEDIPENLAEETLLTYYYFGTSFEFDGLVALQGNERLQINAENDRENAADGWDFENVIIHDFATLTEEDFAPGGAYFADEEKSFKFVDMTAYLKEVHGLTEYAVVYLDLSWKWSEKALTVGGRLDNGRYERLYLVGKLSEDDNWKIYECFWGERDLGRTYSARNTKEFILMRKMFEASNISDVTSEPTGVLLVSPVTEGQSLCAAYFTERYNYELVIAVWDADTNSIVGTPFRAANSSGTPEVTVYELNGEQRLVYTANGSGQGFTYGQAGEIALRDGEMIWEWPVKGDIRDMTRDPAGQPYQDYLDYWDNHLALMTETGLDIFVENEEYGPYEGSPKQWEFDEEETNRYTGVPQNSHGERG